MSELTTQQAQDTAAALAAAGVPPEVLGNLKLGAFIDQDGAIDQDRVDRLGGRFTTPTAPSRRSFGAGTTERYAGPVSQGVREAEKRFGRPGGEQAETEAERRDRHDRMSDGALEAERRFGRRDEAGGA